MAFLDFDGFHDGRLKEVVFIFVSKVGEVVFFDQDPASRNLIRDDSEERQVVVDASFHVVGHLELLTEAGHGKSSRWVGMRR